MIVIQDTKKRFSYWQALLINDKKAELLAALQEAPVADIAEFLEPLSIDICVYFFLLLEQDIQSSLFTRFRQEKQLDIYNKLPVRVFVHIFEEIFSDARADFYLALDKNAQAKLLPYLSKKVRKDVLLLSGYPPERAGGIMTTEFVKVTSTTTAEEALASVRKDATSKKMLYYLYIVNDRMELVNVIDLKELIIADPASEIASFAEKKDLVSVQLNDDQETVARKIENYNLMAVPVLNDHNQIVGIVSYDDAMDIIRAEETEDMEKFMGIVPDEKEQPYLYASSFQHAKQRLPWICVLLLMGVVTGVILHNFEDSFKQFSFIAVYLSMISDTGGNVGSQSATMVIRALSLRELTLKSWRKIVLKELKIALILSIVVFLFCFVQLLIFFKVYPPDGISSNKLFFQVVLAICFALVLQVITSNLIGASLPLVMKKLGKDPALAASPMITTLVDMLGSFMYLTIMWWVLDIDSTIKKLKTGSEYVAYL